MCVCVCVCVCACVCVCVCVLILRRVNKCTDISIRVRVMHITVWFPQGRIRRELLISLSTGWYLVYLTRDGQVFCSCRRRSGIWREKQIYDIALFFFSFCGRITFFLSFYHTKQYSHHHSCYTRNWNPNFKKLTFCWFTYLLFIHFLLCFGIAFFKNIFLFYFAFNHYFLFQFSLYLICFIIIIIIIFLIFFIYFFIFQFMIFFCFVLTVVHWSHFVILLSANNRGFRSATQTFKRIFTHETESRFSFLTFSCVVISCAVSRPKKFSLPVMCWSFFFYNPFFNTTSFSLYL